MKKSTYFDKYGPSGSFTKAAKGTAKITTYLNKPTPDDLTDVLDDAENEGWNKLVLNEKIKNLTSKTAKGINSD